MTYPPNIQAILDRWTSVDYEIDPVTGAERQVNRVINHGVRAFLAEWEKQQREIEALQRENERLRAALGNGKI